ncbi:probable ATP-dependent RNA helicase CG8611 [Tribolium castaneum]|uniref:ATP-dependent RNA helicase n=1 Tax=Tribolium castaneum TaxID=7070 RepID=D6X4S5_TRICA|nr:PREDICTED: probable ATP-dependent RNA helicase CG8611 [Tribolium castaneum]EEZ97652.2 putative ATP-dependent RNA helicase CG8611-like Protein [Tribolium castaneum]|eukprot:XP_008199116.1 PREDICTED: probable ATP-dependent RNA helicase CG8611 [Tribolium castaneum]
MTSFDFTWNNAAQVTGKAFVRKKSSKKVSTQKQTAPPKKAPESRTAKNKSLEPDDNQQEKLSGYVKRKQKKDKLAAKAASDGNQQISKGSGDKSATTSYSLFAVRHKDIYVNTNIKGKSVVEKVFSGEKKFSDLQIHKYLVANLQKHSFVNLTNVQERAIPEILAGKNVLIRSQTGSGKTLAYALPIMNALLSVEPRLQRQDGVQAIIVVPTRELALQTHEIFGKINTFQWLVIGHLCGGENRKTEKDKLRKGVHVVIGTPGRLLDHILHTSAFKTENVKCLVLDEADRLLDMGFKKDIVKIVEALDRTKQHSDYDPMAMLLHKKTQVKVESKNQEKKRQTILLSATLNKGIAELADFLMKNHTYIDTLDDSPDINPDHMVIPNTVTQEFIMTHIKHRLFTLSAVLLAKAKHKVFVFMATSQMVDYHYDLFTKYFAKMPKNRGKLKIGEVAVLENEDFEDSDEEEEVVLESEFFKLHGNMDQGARKKVFMGFKAAKRGILLCTDVAARGVDVPEADCIIQYTGPQSDDDYLHRVGRTGRAGKSGSSLIFLTHEEQEYIARLQDHKVFLKERQSSEFLKHLCTLMEEPEEEKAATALQRRFETALTKDKDLHRLACFAYSSWSRFYNTFPGQLRSIFNFKTVNLGHYVTSFGLRETPSSVARIVKGQVSTVQPRRLNKKLATHGDEEEVKTHKRKIKSVSLTTSEFASGLEPKKKKKKKKTQT